jgi:hypothetical protein
VQHLGTQLTQTSHREDRDWFVADPSLATLKSIMSAWTVTQKGRKLWSELDRWHFLTFAVSKNIKPSDR